MKSDWEYDPDDVGGTRARRTSAETATIVPGGSSVIQRVRITTISDLKEFTEKDQDEGRAQVWLSKVKSTCFRDQASDGEKCLAFVGLLTDPARNWHHHLGRTTRKQWTDLIRSFQTQYCNIGVSVAWQYYHAH
ncbi:hypothetical protein PC116_g21947 [Phytophthora cactorum]|uniref:Uncharacterized protein n=1 Tax=Phytophthora cactorum TaxID=29920 RepID=A0A8T1BWK4_9STRA|nr:hypothetical protein PC114_g20053 [Phytophthora cactorum]KAG2911611.1 hypothetical protein PC117_g19108 [Phytophthora cactorum]KAG2968965.1 hypothetical protein PC119_g24079 [Phytophthora cactorum]KAG3139222.1 hypothetical protein C6341_g20445 [Phytophthora cactorum]KAG3146388.1 hypothetical protein PC128_g24033 [Phytophthora cactorum]